LSKRCATPWLAVFFASITNVYEKDAPYRHSAEVHFFYTLLPGSAKKATHFQANVCSRPRIGFLSKHATRKIRVPAIFRSIRDGELHDIHAPMDAAQKTRMPYPATPHHKLC